MKTKKIHTLSSKKRGNTFILKSTNEELDVLSLNSSIGKSTLASPWSVSLKSERLVFLGTDSITSNKKYTVIHCVYSSNIGRSAAASDRSQAAFKSGR